MSMNNKKMFGAMMAGVFAGAILGVLLAPKSGKETRQDIGRVAKRIKWDLFRRLRYVSNLTREKYRDMVDTVVSEYEQSKDISADEAIKIKRDLSHKFPHMHSMRNTQDEHGPHPDQTTIGEIEHDEDNTP